MANSSEDFVDNIGTCSLKSCQKTIKENDGRVDMRAFPLNSKAHHYKDTDLLASWDSNGCANFHTNCWAVLKDAWRGKGDTLELSDIEASLVKEGYKTAEYHDGHEVMREKARRVADTLRERTYPIIFTGAGISTAAGIGDFRGIFGKWTERDKEKSFGANKGLKPATKARKKRDTKDLRPTYTHEAICKLMETGMIKFLISQNTDGLHVLSGIPLDDISELHGNGYVEKCEKCGKRVSLTSSYRNGHRDPSIQPKKCPRCHINHRTGRRCQQPNCNGCLQNTIINFGDYLEEEILSRAKDEAKKADMVIALGTTLQVSPANDLVTMGKQPIRLVIVNRQTTPYDEICYTKGDNGEVTGSRVHGDCDVFMRELMKNLFSEKELKDWENDRPKRMKVYDERRM